MNDNSPKYPFGPADHQTVAPTATVALTIQNDKTILDFTTALGAAMTINLTIDSEVKKGATLTVKALSDGTARNITCGTGMTGPGLAGTISKTKSAHFEYNGTAFIQMGAALQLD